MPGAILALGIFFVAPVATAADVIVIDKLAIGPAPGGLHVGDTVEWDNHDIFEHSVTARDGSFDLDLKPGAKATFVLKKPGSIAYYCKYHPNMQSRLDVAK